MAEGTSDMASSSSMHQKVVGEANVTAAKGSAGGAKGPRQDPRQPAGTKQASNPHLVKPHGFMDHKAGGKK
jgi:hypothetical protein